MSRAPRLAHIGCLFAVACAEPTVPRRVPTYGFTDPTGNVFHWPADRLPVRFYADPRGELRALLVDAVASWERQFLYAEFRGVLVDDSSAADVIVRWADSIPPRADPDLGPPVTACGGVTQGFLDSTGTAFAGPIETQLSVFTATVYSPGQVWACLQRVTVHEVGHTLGLLQHSPDSRDVMAAPPTVGQPSSGDRQTVETLYHSDPTIGPPPR